MTLPNHSNWKSSPSRLLARKTLLFFVQAQSMATKSRLAHRSVLLYPSRDPKRPRTFFDRLRRDEKVRQHLLDQFDSPASLSHFTPQQCDNASLPPAPRLAADVVSSITSRRFLVVAHPRPPRYLPPLNCQRIMAWRAGYTRLMDQGQNSHRPRRCLQDTTKRALYLWLGSVRGECGNGSRERWTGGQRI